MDRDTLIRRLKYLARRRSTLELDTLLTRIYKCLDWAALSESDLAAVAHIFELDDLVLQKALLAKASAPETADPQVWEMMLRLSTLPVS
jgi:succinate dehydrogenase flavin-adding protein (antitoxin of CptAB toxin-antitoxin module)